MLCKVLTKTWSGTKNEQKYIADTTNGSYILFQGSHINGILVRASTKSSFLFSHSTDPKEKPSYVEGEGTAASVVTDADKTWQSAFVTLNFYTGDVTTGALVATRVNCESISFVYADPTASATRSYVVYYEGTKRKRRLCNYSINQIFSLVDDGNLTT